METKRKLLVNAVALKNCSVEASDFSTPILDISFLRLVIEPPASVEEWTDGKGFDLVVHLDKNQFRVRATLQALGEGWARLAFEKIVPSSQAHLRSFLSPKKVGESILEDWRNNLIRHYHGLNESELWFDQAGGMLFSYLDSSDRNYQLVLRVTDTKPPLRVGKMPRDEYMKMANVDQDLLLGGLNDGEIYLRLGECRDIVTNFRPNGQVEYHLKQKLLKVISDHLYSTSRRVETSSSRALKHSSSTVNL